MNFIFATLAAMALSTSAIAAEKDAAPSVTFVCRPRADLVKGMIADHASPITVMRSGDTLFEIWSNGEHWMATVTRSSELTCPVAEGEGEVPMEEPRCIDPIHCPRV